MPELTDKDKLIGPLALDMQNAREKLSLFERSELVVANLIDPDDIPRFITLMEEQCE